MAQKEKLAGHRARLRERFVSEPAAFSEVELLELLLTFAIPRVDVSPLARQLLDRFGTLVAVCNAPIEDLTAFHGIGENSTLLLKAVARTLALSKAVNSSVAQSTHVNSVIASENGAANVNTPSSKSPSSDAPKPGRLQQPHLVEIEQDLGPIFNIQAEPTERAVRVFANDEVSTSLTFVPKAHTFESHESFRAHLQEQLPYNSTSTRVRRASYILSRYFPDGRLDVPLAYFATHCASAEDLKAVLFYHTLLAEPMAARVADELIWPAVPVGRLDQSAIREFVLRIFPTLSKSSLKNTVRSLTYVYTGFGVAVPEDHSLNFHLREGTLAAFFYVLRAEFPEPGMYSFEALENGPARHWLLWDREWMRRQLYTLRDAGLVAKISEIDRMRQFSLSNGLMDSLREYFDKERSGLLVLREGNGEKSDGEGY